MTSCQDLEQLLDDFVDGEATPDERRRVEQHLADCAPCRGVVEQTRALLASTETLARQIPPGSDLWPEIRTEIAAAPAWSGSRTRWIGLAASLLVVMLAGSTARGPSSGRSRIRRPRVRRSPSTTLIAMRRTQAENPVSPR